MVSSGAAHDVLSYVDSALSPHRCNTQLQKTQRNPITESGQSSSDSVCLLHLLWKITKCPYTLLHASIHTCQGANTEHHALMGKSKPPSNGQRLPPPFKNTHPCFSRLREKHIDPPACGSNQQFTHHHICPVVLCHRNLNNHAAASELKQT